MDPIQSIKPWKDSSLAMLLEAQQRGWELFYAQISDLWLEDGRAMGRLAPLRVFHDSQRWFQLDAATIQPLGQMDVVLMRKDPPFDIEYIVATYTLERAQAAGTLVVNDPRSLRDANEKVFLAWFPQCSPPTLVCRDLDVAQDFIQVHGQVVIKPLDLMGGRSVFVTDVDDPNRNVILETVTQRGAKSVMLQKYLPAIRTSGDKRIILVDGRPFPWALARIPTGGDHRGNLDAGARSEVLPLSERDHWICQQVGPVLNQKGLLFAGIDIIGDFLTEVNVTSPTGIRELEGAQPDGVAQWLWDAIQSSLVNRQERIA
jgi:glutathione synthase